MGWIDDMKWAVKGMLGKKKTPSKNPAKPVPVPPEPAETQDDNTITKLKGAGITQDELDTLMGKKKKKVPDASYQ
jgi:hypothetical protein